MITNLHIAAAGEPVLAQTFLVMERPKGDWDTGSKVIDAYALESAAEEMAMNLKKQFPQRHFGVAVIRSETRVAPQPFVIVRTESKQ